MSSDHLLLQWVDEFVGSAHLINLAFDQVSCLTYGEKQITSGYFVRRDLYGNLHAKITLCYIGTSERCGFLWLQRKMKWISYWSWEIDSRSSIRSCYKNGESNSLEEAKTVVDEFLSKRGFKFIPDRLMVMT